MEATVHFYDDSTDCVLAVARDNGGVNNILFEAVSSLVNYAKEIGATIACVVTHKAGGSESVTI
jgi:hypothetical protein